MNEYIKSLISDNKFASTRVAALEDTIRLFEVSDEKSKANFSNLTIALHGYRMVSQATECLLLNENVVKTEDGEFYQKIDSIVRIVDVNKKSIEEPNKPSTDKHE
jgi:hypothetical protein